MGGGVEVYDVCAEVEGELRRKWEGVGFARKEEAAVLRADICWARKLLCAGKDAYSMQMKEMLGMEGDGRKQRREVACEGSV